MKNIHINERSNVASNLRPHFLSVKLRERYGALRRKSCLSEASSFPLAEYPTGIAQKVQTAVFLFCYLFSFCCQKEKSKSSTSQIKEHHTDQYQQQINRLTFKVLFPEHHRTKKERHDYTTASDH